VHPKYKTRYRVGNWPEYDRALVERGDVTVWLTPDAIATWAAVGVCKRGGQLQYSDAAIETALTLRLIFHLPLRQTEGFLTSIFGMLGVALSAPDHTTLSRRGQRLDLSLRRVPLDDGIHLIVDSTGLSIVGEAEWAAAKHGGRGQIGGDAHRNPNLNKRCRDLAVWALGMGSCTVCTKSRRMDRTRCWISYRWAVRHGFPRTGRNPFLADKRPALAVDRTRPIQTPE
jgi:hypothetical protein